MKLILIILAFSYSMNSFADSGEQFGLNRKDPPQDIYSLFANCVKELLSNGVPHEKAEKDCSHILDGANSSIQTSPSKVDNLTSLSKGEEQFVHIKKNGNYFLIPSATLISAVILLSNLDIKISPETKTVIATSSVTAGAIVLFKYGRSATPVGAFLMALGVGPAAATDLCGMYESEEGLNYFLNLSTQDKILEASYCPALAGQIISAAELIKNN